MFIYPYRVGSNSARALSRALPARIIRHENSRFRGSPNKVVINWGASELPREVMRCRVLNKPELVAVGSNKLKTFQRLQAAGVPIPEYTTDRNLALKWIQSGRTVVARRSLTGHSGHGIEILQDGLDFVEAPCYTCYVPKTAEYRVHVIGDSVVDVQRKVRDPEREVSDWKVRSHQNGFIFIRNNEAGNLYKDVCEEPVRAAALAAVKALGLDFSGVDIVFNRKLQRAFVLELNSACGLEGHSVEVYRDGLKKLTGEL